MAKLGLEASSLVSAGFLVAQDWAQRYSETSHATWASLLNSLQPLSDQTSCSKLLRGQEAIGLDTQRIPKFEDLTKRLSASTGWEIVGANGFIPNEAYFTQLANKRFPIACDIRSLKVFEALLYLKNVHRPDTQSIETPSGVSILFDPIVAYHQEGDIPAVNAKQLIDHYLSLGIKAERLFGSHDAYTG